MYIKVNLREIGCERMDRFHLPDYVIEL